jgi:acetoin utilization deacetylase AcuC-like enzyme
MVKIAYHSLYAHPLPDGHRFPMLKYELIPAQLLHEGTITNKNIFAPLPCNLETVLLTHDDVYVQKLINQALSVSEQRAIGFPQSPQLTEREFIITQGTIDCCIYALQTGIALNIAGGTHHAFANKGEGFCLLNDMAVATNYLLQQNKAKRIFIIDLDVHQGNGTAALFENNANVFTFSMHGAHNYPFRKENSSLDIGLIDGCTTAEYLNTLQENLPVIIQQFKPDFAFFLSGVDILETDKFGKLKVTLEGCKQRDAFVFSILKSLQIPVCVAMGGGYSADIKIIVDAHCNTFREAVKLYG